MTVRGITRTPLPDGVRVSIEMDRELLFKQERLENPRRVFFDLRGAHLSPGLRDKTLTFPDDIVREIRLGRHPQNTTRVVMDTEGVESYSVFTLYNPYRVIVDFRRKGLAAAPALVPGPPVSAAVPTTGFVRPSPSRCRLRRRRKPAPIVVSAPPLTPLPSRPVAPPACRRRPSRSPTPTVSSRWPDSSASACRASCSTRATAATIPACAATA